MALWLRSWPAGPPRTTWKGSSRISTSEWLFRGWSAARSVWTLCPGHTRFYSIGLSAPAGCRLAAGSCSSLVCKGRRATSSRCSGRHAPRLGGSTPAACKLNAGSLAGLCNSSEWESVHNESQAATTSSTPFENPSLPSSFSLPQSALPNSRFRARSPWLADPRCHFLTHFLRANLSGFLARLSLKCFLHFDHRHCLPNL